MQTIRAIVFLVETFSEPKIWHLDLPAMSPDKAADIAFKISNAPPEFLTEKEKEILRDNPRDGMRSMSKGDIIVVDDIDNPGTRLVGHVKSMGFSWN